MLNALVTGECVNTTDVHVPHITLHSDYTNQLFVSLVTKTVQLTNLLPHLTSFICLSLNAEKTIKRHQHLFFSFAYSEIQCNPVHEESC